MGEADSCRGQGDLQRKQTANELNLAYIVPINSIGHGPGMCGAAFYSAGRGGAKKRANQPIQKIYKSAKNIILHIIILIII